MRRRKEPDSGVGSYTAGAADEEGTMRHDDPRLQTQRHYHLVRRPGNPRRQGRRRMLPETPAPGVSEIPAAPQHRVSGRCPLASHHGQLRDAQARESKGMAQAKPPLRASLRPHWFQLDESDREMVWPPGSQG